MKSYMKMTDAEQRAEALRLAEKVVEISMEEALQLKGMLAPIVSGQLKYRGWCPQRVGGVNTFYVLKASA